VVHFCQLLRLHCWLHHGLPEGHSVAHLAPLQLHLPTNLVICTGSAPLPVSRDLLKLPLGPPTQPKPGPNPAPHSAISLDVCAASAPCQCTHMLLKLTA